MSKQVTIEENPLPRVLVISPALSFTGNNGCIYGPLFQGWPHDRIAQIHTDAQEPSPELCTRSWRLSLDDVPLDARFRPLLTRLFHSGKSGCTAGQGVVVGGLEHLSFQARAVTKAHLLIRAWMDLVPFRLSRDFWEWVHDFRPEVIFSSTGSIRMIRLTSSLARRRCLPIIADFRDDYPNALYRESLLAAFPRRVLMGQLARMMALSPIITAGSEPLGKLYSKRYGIPSSTFIPPVQHSEIHAGQAPAPVSHSEGIKFVYVGGLHLNRWQQLIEIGTILAKVQTQSKAELVIYAPESHLRQHQAALLAQPCIRVAGALKQDAVFPILRQADVLVHVESFDPQIQRYTWMSVSTKIPQYMAAGRPILAYGPAALASLQHIEETSCGIVVGHRDSAELLAAVRRLQDEPGLRGCLGKKGWQAAQDKHDADRERERFRQLARAIAVSGRAPKPRK
ncbi:MAG: glycosyltransferase [bacterium]